MLKKSSIAQLVENLLSNIVVDAEVGNRGSDDSGNSNKMIERSPYVFNLNGGTSYRNCDTRKTFSQLRQALTQALILQHFPLEQYIWNGTDDSDYAIDAILN